MKKYCTTILLGLFTLTSCWEEAVFEEYKPVPGKEWDRKEKIAFDVEIQELTPLDIYVSVRNTDAYTKANLWLFIEMVSPDGYRQRDTLNCILADKYGTWQGSGFGGLYDSQHLLEEKVSFSQKGVWTIIVEQAMRDELLPGIRDVGVLLRKEKS